MKSKIFVLAFALTVGSAFAAPPTPIPALPFVIRTPGTYILTSDLTVSCSCNAITLDPNLPPGPIVIDLKGHTIHGGGDGNSDGTGFYIVYNGNIPITIKNGTIHLFREAVAVLNPNGLRDSPMIELNNLTFEAQFNGIDFYRVFGAKVKNCVFDAAERFAIFDSNGQGNVYTNLTFKDCTTILSIGSDDFEPYSIDRLQVESP